MSFGYVDFGYMMGGEVTSCLCVHVGMVSDWGFMVCASCLSFALAMITIHLLTESTDLLQLLRLTSSQRPCYVVSCRLVCYNAYKRFLVICHKSKALCPVSYETTRQTRKQASKQECKQVNQSINQSISQSINQLIK